MTKVLEALYTQFYEPSNQKCIQDKIEEAHSEIIENGSKLHRKMALQIIDSKDIICEINTEESFQCGFMLALEMLIQLQTSRYKTEGI